MPFTKVIHLSEALHFLVLLLAWTDVGGMVVNVVVVLPTAFNNKALCQTKTF